MPSQITPKLGIMDIAPYMGGESQLRGVAKTHKLSSNENPLGPSAKAVAAFQAVANTLERYPSSDHLALRTAIGDVHGLDPAQIICGDGSDEVISWLCFAYAGQGDEVLYTEHGFSMYGLCAQAAGATPVMAGESNRQVDVDKLLAAVTEQTRLVFVTNPGNPTSTVIPLGELERLADSLPPKALLVLDGAYAEFEPGYDGGASLVEARDNVVMTRTFSKVYGLAGLRVGWCFGPRPIIEVLNRLRGPFNVTAAGLAAAEAAVKDREYLAHCLAENAHWRDFLQNELAAIGIQSDPAHANFILARFESADVADAADQALRAAGIIIRQVKGYGLPDCLRITVGDAESCTLVVKVLTKFMVEQG